MAEVTDVTVKKRLLIQLGIPFFAMVAFVVAAVIFGTLSFAGRLANEDSPQDPKFIAGSVSDALGSFFAEARNSVAPVLSYPANGAFSSSEEEMLRSLLSGNATILGVAYFDEGGNRVYELHKSRAKEELLSALFKGQSYVGLLKDSPDGRILFLRLDSLPYFIAVFPRTNAETQTVGAFSIALDGAPVEATLRNFTSISPSRIEIVDAKSAATLFGLSTLGANAEGSAPTQNSLRTIFENNKKDYGYILDDGTRVEGRVEPIENTAWNVLAETPGAGLPEGAGNLFVVAAIILILFVILAFVYLYVVNKNVILPLKKIEKTMHYFRTGDYSEPVKVEVENEFVSIADQLNAMSKHIENNTSERVSQLKKVLARQNTDTRLLIEKDVELREQGQKLKELDQAKSMFVSVAAHQMRTPLAAIKWAIKLVMDGDVGPVNAEQKEYLGKGYDSTTRMINLINDLLDVDKIESDRFSYVFKEEKLEGIVQGIVDDLTPISTEKGVNLIFQKESPEYPVISADQVKLRNALQNLVDNAIKYTIGGGDVTIKLRSDKDVLHLTISDTGIGIPVSEQSKVFGKFFRAKNAVRQQTDGSGLGLFIVKKIIEKHNGEIRFESKEGKGTTFFITIPGKDAGGVPLTENSDEKVSESLSNKPGHTPLDPDEKPSSKEPQKSALPEKEAPLDNSGVTSEK